MELTKYELSQELQNQINEIFTTLLEICQIYNIPMYATVATKNTDEKTEYKSVILNPASHEIKLYDDQIRKNMLVANGFSVVPPREAKKIRLHTE